MNECIFCEIIEGKRNARRLYEDANALCILDIGQVVSEGGGLVAGRCLVIPKRHVTWFYDLEDEEAGQLFIAAKAMAKRIKKAFNPDFVTVFIRGQRIPHAHIILQPSCIGDAMDKVFTSLVSYFQFPSQEVLDKMAEKLRRD